MVSKSSTDYLNSAMLRSPFYGLCRSTTAIAFVGAVLAIGFEASARNFRVQQMPNGGVFACSNCHLNRFGGGPRTDFGEAVFAKIGGSSGVVPFWDSILAGQDSDGDGATNGQELGDPDGTWTVGSANPPAVVSNPGDDSSVPPPPNEAPGFTSSAVTTAFVGEPYSYQAEAFDVEGDELSFSKLSGPEWIDVSFSGLVSGTPPVGSVGTPTVAIRVTDDGLPNLSTDQEFTLTVKASFTGFQNLNFDLPGEAAIAAADADPDEDDLPNIVEYALKTNPRSADGLSIRDAPAAR